MQHVPDHYKIRGIRSIREIRGRVSCPACKNLARKAQTDKTKTMHRKIGITTRTDSKQYQDRWFRNYWWAILWAGGEPVVLTPETATLAPEEQIAQLDGLFLPGGGDVHPSYYNQPMDGSEPENIDLARDALELPLTRAALAANIPILGVCRGMQVLNIAAGGGLLQHVDGHRSPPDTAVYHDVDVIPNTLLAQVMGVTGRLATNTYHHQAVTADQVAPGFRASARATEGLPFLEAMEGEGWRWVLAVQWHPERFFELAALHRRLFSEFVAAAGWRGSSEERTGTRRN